jgi:Subtilase family
MSLTHRLRLIAAAIACISLSGSASAGLNITAEGQSRLEEALDREIVVVVAAVRGHERDVIRTLHITKSETIPEFGITFVKANAQEVLAWQDDAQVDFIDILDDSQAATVYNLLAKLHRVEFLDDLGVFKPGVLNISIGPPRSLIGKDGSGERAVQRAIRDVIERHGIPVVMSAGNDGPQAGFINGWAPAGAFIATATDAKGTLLWDRSSRYSAPMPDNVIMFAANGIDTIGARAGCRPKSQAQQEADDRAHLDEIVGKDKAPCFEVASGTSFAAAFLTQSVCLLHQALAVLALKTSGLTPVNQSISLAPFVRAYIDNGFDRSHPQFANRLADSRFHYEPLTVSLSQSTKEDARRVLLDSGVDVDIHYRPAIVHALLRRAAVPVGQLTREEIGYGFVSGAGIANMLAGLHYDALVESLAESDPRRTTWVNRIRRAGNPLVFEAAEIDRLQQYCQSYDLILGLPLFGQP